MKIRDEIQVTVEKLAYGGKGIARLDNRVVFVDGAVPGDTALVRIQKVKRNHAEARVVSIISPSSLRQSPPCQHADYCGGCKWQHLAYDHQLRVKKELVKEALEHIGGFKDVEVLPTIASPSIFAYRNKMEFSFTDRRWLPPPELENPEITKGFALGLHVPGAFDRVMHIDYCWLQDDLMNQILNFTQEYFRQGGFSVYNLKTHEGFLRFLVLRKSFAQEKYMVNLVTSEPGKEKLSDYVQQLTESFPSISSVVNTVNRRVAQIAFGEEEYLLYGEPALKEKLGDYEFLISANSFFQTNPLQACKLFETTQQFVGGPHSLVWDLYSGTGTIDMFLSGQAKRIVGFELVGSAVKDAEANCRQNGVTNCEFISGDIRENILKQNAQPDVIVTDPPRSGMHPDVVEGILAANPQKIVYVSCNPTTMARDLKILSTGYNPILVQPIDMFPHTYHIETIVLLERK
ncbi:MAG: 23S rRNA (uracil(1939)-C(5))-methyltransferase RlmD [Calditrichia bacterium]